MLPKQADPFADTQRFDVLGDTQRFTKLEADAFDVMDELWFEQSPPVRPTFRARLACAVAGVAVCATLFSLVI